MGTGLLLSALVLCTVTFLLLPASALAQGRDRHTPQSVLFHTCVHETSIPVPAEDEYGYTFWARTGDHGIEYGADCWLIHEVFLNGAHFLNRESRFEEVLTNPHFAELYVRFALRHSEAVFSPSPGDVNVWARELYPPFRTRPPSWTRLIPVCEDGICSMRPAPGGHAFGQRQRDALTFVWELTEEIVTHELADADDWSRCGGGTVDSWGGTMDHEHAAMMGFVEIECDPSANTGFAYPSRIRARQAQVEEVSDTQ
jgi:hypothetical protein